MELPAQTFFQPTEAWWKLLEDTPWLRFRRYQDIGAGMGDLTDAMEEHGYDCNGYDLCSRTGQSERVVLEDGVEQYFNWDDCVILARPNHGHGLELLLEHHVGTCEVLYVGLVKNVERDLGGYVHEAMTEGWAVGEEGEVAIRVICKEGEGEQWCQITNHYGNLEWWMDDGNRWTNSAGGGFPQKGEKVHQRIEIADPYQMYGTFEELCDQKEGQDNGWIDPAGGWYPAQSSRHAIVLQGLLGITERRAEELGFVRCYGSKSTLRTFYTRTTGKPTIPQLKRLRALGFDLKGDFEKVRETL